MKLLSYRNRGSIIEAIMNNTSQYYRENKIAYFRKTNPLYAHISRQNKSIDCGLLGENCKERTIKFTHKGDLDYYGLYKGRYFSIELKETNQTVFALNLIREHQFSQLEEIHNLGGIALVLIHFIHEANPFWLITYPQLKSLQNIKKAKKFSAVELKAANSFSIEIIYPHILNLQPILEKLISEKYN